MNSSIFELKRLLKGLCFRNNFCCAANRAMKLRKLGIYKDEQQKIIKNNGKVGEWRRWEM